MAEEIERKFLVNSEAWRSQANDGERLQQAYVLIDDHGSARVRISGNDARIALKFGAASLARYEFEYSIPVEDARSMMQLRVGEIIEKTRYRITFADKLWEVDEFHGALDGLLIAEVELDSKHEELAEIPPWLGVEITANSAYYNQALATEGQPGK